METEDIIDEYEIVKSELFKKLTYNNTLNNDEITRQIKELYKMFEFDEPRVIICDNNEEFRTLSSIHNRVVKLNNSVISIKNQNKIKSKIKILSNCFKFDFNIIIQDINSIDLLKIYQSKGQDFYELYNDNIITNLSHLLKVKVNGIGAQESDGVLDIRYLSMKKYEQLFNIKIMLKDEVDYLFNNINHNILGERLMWLLHYKVQKNFLKHNHRKNKYVELMDKLYDTNLFGFVPYDDVCFILKKPDIIKRNELGKLHCIDGQSIIWNNLNHYYLNGIYFDNKIYNKFINNEMTAIDILKIGNIEQRFTLLKLYKIEKLLIELEAKLLDKSEKGNELYSIDTYKVFKVNKDRIMEGKEQIKILKYKCTSTGRVYMKFVPYYIDTADNAQAWSHGYSLKGYLGIKNES